jgi:uncharacterized protein YdeI (YjbR/CyaY-like superfamily)
VRPRLVAGLPVVSPGSPGQWEKWLAANHDSSPGVWLRLRKKGAGRRSLSYPEALDAALCYGWIDGQKRSGDKASWLQKFTRRGARSRWSKKNTEHAERLTRAGRMRAPGLAQIESARKDGRWKAAYDPPSRAAVPEEFLRELGRDKKALAFFKTLNRANLYAIAYRLQTAKKPETRERRMRLILRMLANGETFH